MVEYYSKVNVKISRIKILSKALKGFLQDI